MSAMEKINIVSIIGNSICVAAEDGQKVYDAIYTALQEGKNIEISFKGIEDLTTLFLNAAIGQLYDKFKDDELKNRMFVVDASSQDLDTLKHSVERAKEYFKDKAKLDISIKETLGDE